MTESWNIEFGLHSCRWFLFIVIPAQVQEASRLSGRTHAPHLVARVHKAQTSAAINDFIGSLSRVRNPPVNCLRISHSFPI